MKTFKEYILEVVTFKNNSHWVLSPSGFEMKKMSGASEHPDLFPHLNFMGREANNGGTSMQKIPALSWGRIDHDNKVIHIITQNGGIAPNRLLRRRQLEDDVYARQRAIPHLRQEFPDFRIHVGGPSALERTADNIQTHSYSEHEKFLTGHLNEDQ